MIVVGLRVCVVWILELLVGDGRKEHDLRTPSPAVVFGFGRLEKLVELLLEFVQAGVAFERLVESKEGENYIGLRLGQPIIRRTKILGAMADNDFIASHGQIAKDQVLLRELRVNECLQPA